MHDIENLTEKLKHIVKNELTASRYRHSLSVAEIAQKIAAANDISLVKKAYLAGLCHDYTKQKKNEFHISVFNNHGFDYSTLPTAAYHAFSGRFLMQEYIDDNDILNSIQSHTLGHGKMGQLEQIIYAADFLGSDYAMGKKKKYPLWLEKTKMNICFGVYLKSRETIDDLLSKKMTIHPYTLETYNFSLSDSRMAENLE